MNKHSNANVKKCMAVIVVIIIVDLRFMLVWMNDAPVIDDDNDVDDVNRNNDEMDENQTENVGNCIQLIDRKTIILL